MLKEKDNQLSIYSILYSKIPENHTLKQLRDHLNFSFINELLEDTYSARYGRPAKEPEMMVKLLFLQKLYNLSDVRVIEEASLNLAYMYFLEVNPEDSLSHPSLLTKFRKGKLEGNLTADGMMTQIVHQAIEMGIIPENTGLTVDTTHTEANTFKCTPERVMKRYANKIFRSLKEESGEVPDEINQEIPKEIEDHKEAKTTMKTYLEDTIEKAEEKIDLENSPKTKRIIDDAKKALDDPKFLEQKGVRSIVDQDARVGHKSKTSSFFGYKTEYMMTTEGQMITAVHVANGAYVDGSIFEELLEKTLNSGLIVDELFGDKAYFRKPILDRVTEIGAKPYIPVSEQVYWVNEDLYSYNKDSDEWFCEQGNKTIKKSHKKRKDGRQSYKYYFDREICRDCPLRELCVSPKSVGKILEIGINTPEFYGYSQEQKKGEFKEKYRKRACQEGKNGEMKNFHGLDRAKWYDLKSIELQAKLTANAVNLKRIAKLLSSQNTSSSVHIVILLKKPEKNCDINQKCA